MIYSWTGSNQSLGGSAGTFNLELHDFVLTEGGLPACDTSRLRGVGSYGKPWPQ